MARDTTRFVSLFLPASTEPASEPAWPPMDVYRSPTGWLVKMDLAGVKPEDVQLRLSGPLLIVSGERRDWCVEDGCRHYRMEITYSRFERRVELGEELSEAHIETEFRDGMLLVRVCREVEA